MNLIWTYAGLPTVTLPAALDAHGLPLGIQLTGARMGDAAPLAAAVAIEQALGFDARLGPRSDAA